MANEDPGPQRGFSIGRYWTHSFFIRTHTFADLRPEDGGPMPIAVPVHVHEYVHYLHNTSTVSGLHLFVANLWLLRSFLHFTDRYGHVSGGRNPGKEERHWLNVGRDWLLALWGRDSWSDGERPRSVKVWRFGPAQPTVLTLDLRGSAHSVDLVSIDVDADCEGGKAAAGRVDVGYDLISEGVAYEVDREVRRANGAPEWELDRRTEDYPYLFYRALVERWVGRSTRPLERIEVGVYALLTSSPAATLLELCTALRTETEGVSTHAGLPDSVASLVLKQFQAKAMDCINKTLHPELEALSVGGDIQVAAQELRALFQAGFSLRTINPILENNFLSGPLTAEQLTYIIGHRLLDHCVLQEGPSGIGRLEWIGSGIAGWDQKGVEALARLQAATHFARLHLTRAGDFAKTAQLSGTRCLFSGACKVERTGGMPEACRTRPWMKFMDAGADNRLCWYAGGVKALANVT